MFHKFLKQRGNFDGMLLTRSSDVQLNVAKCSVAMETSSQGQSCNSAQVTLYPT